MQNGRQLGRGMQARLTEIASCDTRLAELVIRLVEAVRGLRKEPLDRPHPLHPTTALPGNAFGCPVPCPEENGHSAQLSQIATLGTSPGISDFLVRSWEVGCTPAFAAYYFVLLTAIGPSILCRTFSRISALVAVTVAVGLQIAVSWSPLSTATKVMPR